MIQYPIHFFAESKSEAGIQTHWNAESSGHDLKLCVPTEFEGPGGALSPEDLFAQALTQCFIATFKVYTEKSKAPFSSVDVKTELVVDLDDSKKPVMKKATLNVTILGATNPDRIKMLAQRAFQSGFILNSVKTELQLNLNI